MLCFDWRMRLACSLLFSLLFSLNIRADSISDSSDILVIKGFAPFAITQPASETTAEGELKLNTPKLTIDPAIAVELLEPDGSVSDVIFSQKKGDPASITLASDPGPRIKGMIVPPADLIPKGYKVIAIDESGKLQDISEMFGFPKGSKTIQVTSDVNVPEPSALLLFGIGVTALAVLRFRRRPLR